MLKNSSSSCCSRELQTSPLRATIAPTFMSASACAHARVFDGWAMPATWPSSSQQKFGIILDVVGIVASEHEPLCEVSIVVDSDKISTRIIILGKIILSRPFD